MAKIKGAFGGYGVSGTVGKVYTFGKWKGVQYARQHVVPANPKTPDQTTERSHFTAGVNKWHNPLLVALDKILWKVRARLEATAMSGFNSFMKVWRLHPLVVGWVLIYDFHVQLVGPNVDFNVTADANCDITLSCIRGPQAGYSETLPFIAGVSQFFAGVPIDGSSVFVFTAYSVGVYQGESGYCRATSTGY